MYMYIDNRLLLQQRAGDKITFPSVWTNTCCSHPLHISSEIDYPDRVNTGEVIGNKVHKFNKKL